MKRQIGGPEKPLFIIIYFAVLKSWFNKSIFSGHFCLNLSRGLRGKIFIMLQI